VRQVVAQGGTVEGCYFRGNRLLNSSFGAAATGVSAGFVGCVFEENVASMDGSEFQFLSFSVSG
jgi:hypothetical protein